MNSPLRNSTLKTVFRPLSKIVWRSLRFGGGQLGVNFGEVWGEVFGLFLLGHSEQKQTSGKSPAQKSLGSAQQNWRKFREKLHDEVLRGDPRQRKITQSNGHQTAS